MDKYTNLEWEGIDHNDHPDYCDAYIVSGECNGVEMTQQQLEDFSNSDFKYDYLLDYLN